ncbi:MAG: toll/interleukin-1 receptor domain-containing protein [Deltaproteobacteria bacterium]|nr:toll/interleukin-1 receptor domain-containing protein [Deltaproteobacteria bacterium]
MANEEHLAILRQGVEVWNKWREDNPDIRPDLEEADFAGADLSEIDLGNAYLLKANLKGANLFKAYLHHAYLSEADLTGANLCEANLAESDLVGAYANGADFADAELRHAEIWDANFSGADLSCASLFSSDLGYTNFSKANLRQADISKADLHFTDLGGAKLCEANFEEANLNLTNLRGADLENANLQYADLGRADLRLANLKGADLRNARLNGAALLTTCFENVKLAWTSFSFMDLRQAKGLDTAFHFAPSHVDIHTLYRSEGEIPEAFLKGAGIGSKFISRIPSSFSGKPVRAYSCFICHSSKDRDFLEKLRSDLYANAFECWLELSPKEDGPWRAIEMEEMATRFDKLLLVLSDTSLGENWIDGQLLGLIREDEDRNNRRKLFSIRLADEDAVGAWKCDDRGKDMAAWVREGAIHDFSTWKDHGSYTRAFDRLLKDLQAEPKTNPIINEDLTGYQGG